MCGAHKIYWYQYTTRIVQAARLQTMCGRLFGGQETNILKFTRRSVIISPKWDGFEGNRKKVFEAGVNAHIAKPFSVMPCWQGWIKH